MFTNIRRMMAGVALLAMLSVNPMPASADTPAELNQKIVGLETTEFDDEATLAFLKEQAQSIATGQYIALHNGFGIVLVRKTRFTEWVAVQVRIGAISHLEAAWWCKLLARCPLMLNSTYMM